MNANKFSEAEIVEALEPLEQVLEVVDESEPFYVSVGEVVADKYRIEGVLGAGGMGVVLSAKHVDLGEQFALKFLNEEFLREDAVIHRFTQEARAACRIRNEHVARVYDVGVHHGAPFLVMEHLEGSDLCTILKQRGALAIDDAVEYTMQACEALAAAHRHGIVHRDIKPENLFLVEHEGLPSIKVLDFGISKSSLTGGDCPSRLTGQLMLGTPCYMSPEQIRSTATVDSRSDLWSLGVVLYELLAGVEAFRAATVTGVCAAVLEEEPEPLTSFRADVPPGLVAVIARCLAKDPEDRYADVAELAKDLFPFAPPRTLVSVERTSLLLRATDPLGRTPHVTSVRPRNKTLDSGPVSHAPVWRHVETARTATARAGRASRTIALSAAAGCVVVAMVGWLGRGEPTAVPPQAAAASAPPVAEEARLPAVGAPLIPVVEAKHLAEPARPAPLKRPAVVPAPRPRVVAAVESASPAASQAPSAKAAVSVAPPPTAPSVELGY